MCVIYVCNLHNWCIPDPESETAANEAPATLKDCHATEVTSPLKTHVRVTAPPAAPAVEAGFVETSAGEIYRYRRNVEYKLHLLNNLN